MQLLQKILTPADVKKLSLQELSQCSAEITELLVQVVARNGGHLSSNLGVVDLTLALHRVFNAPTDKIIWDIGHQSYTHKIITGRRDRIFSIRKKNGLLGFPDRVESDYDVLNTGHASTSLGFASGLAIARDRQGEKFHIVAVIGDGALTGGAALEAMNHIGQVKQRLIIILNDNKMSISPNVGGISRHLNYLVSGRPYIRLKEVIQNLLKAIPVVGKSLYELAKKVEILMRTMMVPGSLFDELGIKYIGPVNGHDFREMLKEFEKAKKHDFPVLLHVVTSKGKGYVPAAADPSSYHSSAPFNIEDGKFIDGAKSPSYSEIFGRTVLKLVASDRKFVALTAAMPEGTGLEIVQKEFPDNFFDVGIAEQYMFNFAGGLALGGLKPVVGVYSTFMQRAVDQIIHDISLMRIPMLIGLDRAGLVGGDGPTHQGIYDIALLHPLPDIVLMAPKDENELQHMVYTGSRLAKPVFIRYPKEPGRGVPLDKEFVEIPEGRAEVLRKRRPSPDPGRGTAGLSRPGSGRAIGPPRRHRGDRGQRPLSEALGPRIAFFPGRQDRKNNHRRGRHGRRRFRLHHPQRVFGQRPQPSQIPYPGGRRMSDSPGIQGRVAGALRFERCRHLPPGPHFRQQPVRSL